MGSPTLTGAATREPPTFPGPFTSGREVWRNTSDEELHSKPPPRSDTNRFVRNSSRRQDFFARAAFPSRYSRVWGTLDANEHRRRHDTDRCERAVSQFLGNALGAELET